MQFIRLLFGRYNRNRAYLIAWFLASTFSNFAAIGLITSVVGENTGAPVSLTLLFLFLLIAGTVIFSQHHLFNLTVDVCETAVERQRKEFSQAVRGADLGEIEAIGTARLYALINRTSSTLSEAGPPVVSGMITVTLMLSMTLYTLFLSPLTFAVIVAIFAATLYLAAYFNQSANQDIEHARETESHYIDLFVQLLDGIKEIKLDAALGNDLIDSHMSRYAEQSHQDKLDAARSAGKSFSVVYAGFYLLLAAVVLAVPQYLDDPVIATQVAYLTIIMLGLLNLILRAWPMLGRANQALTELDAIKERLRQHREGRDFSPMQSRLGSRVEMHGLSVSFQVAEDAMLQVGPYDLVLEPGEIIVLSGATGSGKTTLLRALCGLVHPTHGQLLWDGRLVDDTSINAYRSLFAVVLPNSHLFDRFYGLDASQTKSVVECAIDLGLPEQLLHSRPPYATHWSHAQRQRLILALALCQQRDVLVLDEIESGQDDWFVTKLRDHVLPDLIAQGKSVLLTTSGQSRLAEVATRTASLPDPRIIRLQGFAHAG